MNNWGESRAEAQRKRYGRVWRDTIVFALIGGVCLGAAAATVTPGPRWTLLAVGLAAMAYALWVGSVRYYRTIDEQERYAGFWSCTIGLYTYVFLYGANFVAERLGLLVARSHDAIFWIVVIVTFGAFIWKRYR